MRINTLSSGDIVTRKGYARIPMKEDCNNRIEYNYSYSFIGKPLKLLDIVNGCIYVTSLEEGKNYVHKLPLEGWDDDKWDSYKPNEEKIEKSYFNDTDKDDLREEIKRVEKKVNNLIGNINDMASRNNLL